ncbi:MAG: YjgP/YjgQ family permease [Candidatus Abyssobacteria bacterium SURF_5]|uniref:YjgP/YjgQ family permease n=1 Tax=Abyssobacteria bacterium (strain SURF_5) TaxID=2093360 RepID=A0A3A4NSW0_ABYX5|nr:MAG: YjgP/YjgQ family permease [Candidatus Abyssubacteria bacterium SURF_5]
MNIIHKHVAREVMVPFFLTFLVITFLVVVGNLLKEIGDRFMSNGLGLLDVAILISYALPSLMIYTIPIALLFATLIAFAQLSNDCEIIAMKSAGIPIMKVFVPAVAVGMFATLLLLILGAEVSPRAKRGMKVFIIEKIMEKPTLVLNEQAWTQEVNNMRIFVGDIDHKRMRLKDVDIVINPDNGPRRNIVAKAGRVFLSEKKDKVFLELEEGAIHEFDMAEPDTYSTTTFGRFTIPVEVEALNRNIRRYQALEDLSPKEMTLSQLIRQAGDPAIERQERRNLLRHVGERTAMAFMPLVFVLVSAPLGIIPHKARRMYGLAVCAGLLLAYYSLLMLGEALAKKGVVNPLLGMWIPNLFLGIAGIICMARAERK